MYFSLKKIEKIKLYLKSILSEERYIFIQNVTDNSREKGSSKKILSTQLLQNKLIKPAILNLPKKEVPKHYESLLNLGPKFVPANKNLPFMDIITLIESCALDMELNHKENEVLMVISLKK